MYDDLHNVLNIYGNLSSENELITSLDPEDVVNNPTPGDDPGENPGDDTSSNYYVVFIDNENYNVTPTLIPEAQYSSEILIRSGVFAVRLFEYDPDGHVSLKGQINNEGHFNDVSNMENPTYRDVCVAINHVRTMNAAALFEKVQPINLYNVTVSTYVDDLPTYIDTYISPNNPPYAAGTSCTVYANIDTSYYEIMWMVNGYRKPNHIDAEGYSYCEFTVNSHTTVELYLTTAGGIEPPHEQHTVKVRTNPIDCGSIVLNHENGEYAYGDECEVLAVPKTGYKFARWHSDMEIPDDEPANSDPHETTDNPHSFFVHEDVSLVAEFEEKEYNVVEHEMNYTIKFIYKGNVIEMKWNPTVAQINYNA